MIVDIGGGTTNICIIQTSGHGRLARAGDNHRPHGVATFDKGGSDIDGLILNRIVKSTRVREASASLSARKAKEIFDAIERSRNVIMHSGTLGKRDVARVGSLINDWSRQVST
jgi:molecular chaperone DnaK (HSP70)